MFYGFIIEGIKSSDNNIGSSSDYNKTEVELGEFSVLAGSFFYNWGCQIINNNNGTVNISGFSEATNSFSLIQVTVYLQKWNGSAWVDIANASNSANNNYYISIAKDVSIVRGYNYRVRATHYISNSGTNESKSSTSSYITVN